MNPHGGRERYGTWLRPEVKRRLEELSTALHGRKDRINLVIEADYMASATYQLDGNEAEEPILYSARVARRTEREVISLLFTELLRERKQRRLFAARLERLEQP